MKLSGWATWSLRVKFSVIIMAVTMAVLVMATILFTIHDRRVLYQQTYDQMSAATRLTAKTIRASLAFGDRATTVSHLRALNDLPSFQYAVVVDSTSEIFAYHGEQHSLEPALLTDISRPFILKERDHLCVLEPVILDRELLGAVIVKSGLGELHATLSQFLLTAISFFLLSALVAWGLSSWASAMMTLPVLDLTETVQSVNRSKNYSLRAVLRHSDEIGELSEGINNMLGVIEESSRTMEEHLRFLEKLFDTIPLPVFYKDMDLKYIGCNRVYAWQMYGVSPEMVVGRSIQDFRKTLTEDVVDRHDARDREIIKSLRNQSYESRLQCADGMARNFLVNKAVFYGSDGQPAGILGIMQDVTYIKRMEKEVMDVSVREQQRIARDLHDNLGQLLTAVAYKCKIIELGGDKDAKTCREEMESVIKLVNRASQEVRALARGLNPVAVDGAGLSEALNELANSIGTYFHRECIYRGEDRVVGLENVTADQLYRIAHEAVTNAVKHSEAETIGIHLKDVDGTVQLEIWDDGKGLPGDVHTASGMGMHIMEHRARLIHAEFSADRRPQGGTSITCRVQRRGNREPKYE